jgi:mannosyltransferase
MPLHMNTAVKSQRRRTLVLLAWCLLLMLAWGLWLWRLDASDLTFDEAATYFVARRPLFEIVDYLQGAVREHPPVYYLLIHGWMALAGTSEFSLRIFSVGTALVGLALTGWLARVAIGRSASVAGLLPAILLAAAPGMAYYAREARMYSLGIVWMTLSAGLFLRDWLSTRERPRRAALVGLVTVHCLALFTHYYLLIPILVQPLALLITRRWRPLLTWCAAHILPALAGLAWLWLATGLQMTTDWVWQNLTLMVPTSFQVFRLLGKILFSPVVQVRFQLLYQLLALAGVGVLLALWRRRPVGVWLVLALLLPPAFAFQMPHPSVARYLLFLTPLLALALGLLGTSPLWLRRRWLAWSGAAGLTLGMVYLLAAGGLSQAITFDRAHYGDTLETVKAHARPGDGMIFYGPWQWIQFQYYDPGDLPPITTLPPQAPPHLKPAEAEPVLEELLDQYDRLWVLPVAVNDVDPERFVAGWLRTHTHAVWKTDDFGLYLPPLPPGTPMQRPGLTFDQALYLEQVDYAPQPVPAGEPLRLTLHWRSLVRLEDVRVTLALADQAGHVWDTASSIPGASASSPSTWQPGQIIIDYEGLMAPQGAAPGKYVVRLMVTDEATGAPLTVEGEKETDLLTVQVVEPTHAPVLSALPRPNAATFCAPDETTCLTLAGYEPRGRRIQQGHPIPFNLHWLSPSYSLPELRLRMRVMHRPWLPLPGLEDVPVLTRTLPLAPVYPAPLWEPDRLVTLRAALTLPLDATTGRAYVALDVLGPDGVIWPTDEGATTFSLFSVTVENRPVLRRLPAGVNRIQVDFGREVRLRGYLVEGDPHPGGQLNLTYIWYARKHPTAIYAVFNHLMTADGELVAQADGWPQEGRMLTIQWRAGEYIEDSYTLVIPPDAPPGPYILSTGLYDAATGERQPAVLDNQRLPEDRLPLPLPGEDER